MASQVNREISLASKIILYRLLTKKMLHLCTILQTSEGNYSSTIVEAYTYISRGSAVDEDSVMMMMMMVVMITVIAAHVKDICRCH